MNRAFSDQLLIFEITKRIAIWDSSASDFYDEQLKKEAWRQVVEVFARPGDSIQAKKNLEAYLQLKWEQARRQSSNEVRQMIVVCKGFLENTTGAQRENLKNLILALRYCDEFDDETCDDVDEKFVLTGITGPEKEPVQSSSDSSDSELMNDLSSRLRRMLLEKSESDGETAAASKKINKKNKKKKDKKGQKQRKEEMKKQEAAAAAAAAAATAQPPQASGSGTAASQRARRGQNNLARAPTKSYAKNSRSLL